MSFGPKLSRMKREKPFGEWTRTNERVGKGGLGDVFVAYHRDDQTRARPHALKQLRNTDRLDRVERFRREVHAALRLEHPGVVKPVASDLNVERPYLVMPLYRKGHLTRDRAARMAPVERLRFFASICRAVGHAHGQRIVHRDIKPENVLITDDDVPVVADFGLCFLQDDDGARVTETLEVAGSRFFSAPELADGRAADVTPAADVYSLGKLLYWLFADGRCFDREKHCDPAFDLRAKEPRLAHALVYEILNRTLVEKPRDRFFQNGNTLADSVDTYAEVLEMGAHVLDLDVRQQCLFCGVGEYKIRVDPRWFVGELHPRPEQKPNEWMDFAGGVCRQYGVLAHPGAPRLILHCNHCGNLQAFELFGGEGADFLKNWNLRPKRG